MIQGAPPTVIVLVILCGRVIVAPLGCGFEGIGGRFSERVNLNGNVTGLKQVVLCSVGLE